MTDVLLLRMGDFYEAFGEEAEKLAKALSNRITLSGKYDTTRTVFVSLAGIHYKQFDSRRVEAHIKGYRLIGLDLNVNTLRGLSIPTGDCTQ